MKSLVVLLFLAFSYSQCFGQITEAPPATAPSAENRLLIDKLMVASGYEKYFIEYCNRKIDKAAKEKKWDPQLISKKKSAVSFSDFKSFAVYNAFA